MIRLRRGGLPLLGGSRVRVAQRQAAARVVAARVVAEARAAVVPTPVALIAARGAIMVARTARGALLRRAGRMEEPAA